MTLALDIPYDASCLGTVDTGISNDAEELRKIRSIRTPNETSYSYYIKKLPSLEEINEIYLEAQKDNWDGYGASRAHQSAIIYAMDFVIQLPAEIPPPEIGLDTDGDIAIEWYYGPRRIISIRVGRDGTLNYAGIVGHATFHGKEFFIEGIPDTILTGIRRILRAS